LHVSSISVYGWPKATGPIAEDTPLGQRFMLWDYYPQAKLLAENLIREYEGDWTVVRPSWIYGPRDRITVSRLIPALRAGKLRLIGTGDNVLNIIYAGDVAEGAILAANHPGAVRQVYNLSSRGEVTQKKLLDTLTDALSVPRVTRRIPFGVARWVAFMQEAFAKATFRKRPPTITRRAIYLVGRPPQFSTAKAREQLGWKPQVAIEEGVRRTLEWLFETERRLAERKG
jgi:nucleoside-diphosphate-sugar epimerase